MALGEGGIDEQIGQRMDAYRNNPQGLQKKYGTSKQLLDLLALQKLKTEKDETAKAMQAAQQQEPGTIAEQREAQALAQVKAEMGGTLGELTGRTSDTLGQQKKVKDKARGNIGKPPQGGGLAGLMGAKPPMRNPQAQGLAGARMAQAATQQGGPQRMAQGGIVGFKTGDLIKLNPADKAKAERAFGPLAASMIANIETMTEGSEAANLMLRRIALETKTPIGRSFDAMLDYVSDLVMDGETISEKVAQNELRLQVEKIFDTSAGALTGPFTQQTPEAQAYAEQVIARLPYMTEQELLTFSQVDFDPLASEQTIATLPVVQKTISDDGTAPAATAEVNPLTSASNPNVSETTFPSTYVDGDKLIAQVNTGYTPEAVTMPPTDDMTATQELLAAAGEATPDASLLAVPAPEIAPLVPTDGTGLTETGEQINAALLERGVSNANKDDIAIQKAAQEASDIYLQRERNRKDYLASAEAERELQSRTMSPAQLASEARIATFSGGRKGRGGMSQAYLEAMKNQRADLSGGLSNLRNIQQNRIATDLDTGQTGSARGGEAAIGARDAIARGEGILSNEVAAQRKSALQGQELKTDLNVAVYKHDSAIAKSTFEEAGKVIARNFSRLTSQLNNDQVRYNALVKQAITDTGAINQAMADQVEQAIAQATARAELAFKNGELAQKGVDVNRALLRQYELEAAKFMDEKLAKDPAYLELLSTLNKMSKAENPDDFAKLQAQIESVYKAHLAVQMLIAPDIFGEQEGLKLYIQSLEAGAPSSQLKIGREGVTSFSEDLDKSGAPGYR